jgi:8-oxo-dGTP pyrophosphatase MutT (NUDIX family)
VNTATPLKRPSSRLLVLDRDNSVLLFKFAHKTGALAGLTFWATPGGGLDPGETFEQAACREVLEEVGLHIEEPGPQIARREVLIQLPTGETALADERFFLIRVDELALSRERWTDFEKDVMVEHRWWTRTELSVTREQVWPENIMDILVRAGAW